MTDYLQRILRARVYDVAVETPLDPAPNLSRRLSNTVLLKREDLQPVFSFKLRGAYNRMAQLTPEELQRGVIASSAGNHAQGVALSASRLGCRAVIVMPATTPEVKVRAVRALEAEVVLHGETYDECSAEARRRCEADGLTFIHPFDDPEVIAGQGTIGLEVMRQSPKRPDVIYLAVGGGGLIGGVAAYVKSLWPEVEIVGVEPVDADAMTQSWLQESGLNCPRWVCSRMGLRCVWWGKKPSHWPNAMWIAWCVWTPMPSAPPSRMSSKTPVPSLNRLEPSPWRG